MSEENALEALAGGKTESAGEWEKKYHELEQKMNGIRVEEGRVRKLDEELKARDKRIAELEAAAGKTALTEGISEEDRAAVPDEVLNYSEKLVGNAIQRERENYDRRLKELEERYANDKAAGAAIARENFAARVNREYPGFIQSVTNGGDKAEQWAAYQRHNAATINGAIREGDFDTLAYHIRAFYSNHLGIPIPSGDTGGSAEPDPRSHGGGTTMAHTNGTVYTSEEYLSLYDKVEEARARGDWAEKKRLEDEIKKAPAEGRVKSS